MSNERVEIRVLNVLIYACIAATAALCAMTPGLLARFGYESAYIGPLWIIGAAFGFAVLQLRGILRRVAAGEPFSKRNVSYLRRISWCCFAVALASLGMIPIYFSLIKALMALFAVAGALVMRVLARVFQMAARQKEEMDLII